MHQTFSQRSVGVWGWDYVYINPDTFENTHFKTFSSPLDVTLIYLARCYNRKPGIHSLLIMVEILLMRTKNKAIHVIRNAVVILQICGSIWYHALGAMISAMNEWRMARSTVFFYYTHTTARMTLAVFSSSAVSLYDDINTLLLWESFH